MRMCQPAEIDGNHLTMIPTTKSLMAMDDLDTFLRAATFTELFEIVLTARAEISDLEDLHSAAESELHRRNIRPPKRRDHASDVP